MSLNCGKTFYKKTHHLTTWCKIMLIVLGENENRAFLFFFLVAKLSASMSVRMRRFQCTFLHLGYFETKGVVNSMG